MHSGAACPRAPPFRVNGEGWGRVACPRVPPSCAYGVARPKGGGEGRCRGRRGQGAACPRAPPFRANEEGWGRGWRALACPLPARTGAARPMGKGEGRGRGERERGGGGVPSYAPRLSEWAAWPRGKGWGPKASGRRALGRTPSTRTGVARTEGKGGGSVRGRGRGGRGLTSCARFLLASNGAAVNVGEREDEGG
ncbi:hypothetical protein EDB84DRAFT_1546198, partial [Lactarius hengduanensis]